MERLKGIDASFLYIETPNNHMHIGMLWILKRPETTAPGGYFAAVRRLMEGRLHLSKTYRRRLVQVPFDVDHPIWIEDPDFDLDFHLRHIAVPPPGDRHKLLEQVARLHSRPLDRSRPLWELYVIEGLPDDQVAVYIKIHHCCIDGMAGTELMVSLLDFGPEPREVPPPERPWVPERAPSDIEVLLRASVHSVVSPLRSLRRLPKVVGAGVAFGRRALARTEAMPAAPFQAPKTPFNRALTPHRRYAVGEVSLDRVKALKNAVGVTVNDVILAMCAGALRRYLELRNELPAEPLLAVCPVSVRTEGENAANNAVSAMFVSLATDIDDPLERIEAIKGHTVQAKEALKALPANMLQDWSAFAAPLVAAQAARLYSRYKVADMHRPPYNVIISNVPGPPFPLYLAGAELVHSYPISLAIEGIALNITIMSYRDEVAIGLTADREAVPDIERMMEQMPAALADLEAALKARKKKAG
ncbi:wax ester/triacylglycerol synthase family O-acyltransferase [Zavarzinia compransoris]|uniref:WS/DGAT/MGAT family O-acyltransferase n=1 Tax=Zavarzinia marina TaxID=2911065 RepID=UPI001F3A467E|nr:wax ester/triacylglycerol synthase family O-acyltransferase [Zavarzinia marina]MCF4166433.1 wax ester/triacylglycerol synthase family O-acyltransferase [Zavarzinia marina]